MTRRTLLLVLALATFALALAACGGDDEEAAPPATEGNGGGQTVQIAADPGGGFTFDKDALEASAGETTFEFTNDASIPHNFTIEGVEGAATETVTQGNDSITVDLEAGTYTYFCSVPGHREGGMEGTLTVE
jgi:plastocyanin